MVNVPTWHQKRKKWEGGILDSFVKSYIMLTSCGDQAKKQ